MWATIIVASAACYSLKFVGAIIPREWLERPIVGHVTKLLPIALLIALVTVQTFAHGKSLTIDARVPALGASAIALRFKAPFIVVVLVAAVTAALLRKFGIFN